VSTVVRCVDCRHEWTDRTGRKLAVLQGLDLPVRCGRCAGARRRSQTAQRTRRWRGAQERCDATSAPTPATTHPGARETATERPIRPDSKDPHR